MTKERFKLVPSSYLVLIKNNKILLSRRFHTGFMDGQYGLVAGHVEKNEGFTKAIIREVKEEIGIKLLPKNLKVVHVMSRLEKQNDDNLRERIDVFFTAKKWQGQIKNLEPQKCCDLSWFSLSKLPSNTIPYIKRLISNMKNKNFYSETGYKK